MENLELERIGISLGWSCHSATWAWENGIRKLKEDGYMTCPFDLMITNYKGVVDCINDDFKYMCDENYLILIPESETENTIYNTKYNFGFNHESPGHANLYIEQNWEGGINHFVEDNYRRLKERYSNRISNFKSYLSNPSFSVTFVLTSWERGQDDISELHEALRSKYPTLKYNVCILNDPNGKEYYLKHMKDMKYTEEINRINNLKL
jgi:hypothetical protein